MTKKDGCAQPLSEIYSNSRKKIEGGRVSYYPVLILLAHPHDPKSPVSQSKECYESDDYVIHITD